MKFTRSTALALALVGSITGCSENETTVAVSVRYWVDHLDPSTFEVTIEQEGQNAIVSAFAPRELNGGDYDVVCQDDWRINYCRFFQRYEVPSWSAGETTVTLTGSPLTGGEPFEETKTFDLVENEINAVYFELEGITAPMEPEPPPPPSDGGMDGGGDARADAGELDTGTFPQLDAGGASDAGMTDAGGESSDASGDAMSASDADLPLPDAALNASADAAADAG